MPVIFISCKYYTTQWREQGKCGKIWLREKWKGKGEKYTIKTQGEDLGGAWSALAPQLSLRMRISHSLETILGRNHSEIFPLKMWIYRTGAPQQSSKPISHQLWLRLNHSVPNQADITEQVGSYGQSQSGMKRCLPLENLSPSLCRPSRKKEGEMSRLRSVRMSVKIPAAGRFNTEDKTWRSWETWPTRAMVRSLSSAKPGGCGRDKPFPCRSGCGPSALGSRESTWS